MAVVGRCCLVSSWRIIHLGMNPVKGGRPPRESSTIGMSAVEIGAFAQEVAKVLMLVALFSFKVKNAAEVIAMYMVSAKSVREGAN